MRAVRVAYGAVQEILKTELFKAKNQALLGSDVRISSRSASALPIVHSFTGISPRVPATLKWIFVSKVPRPMWPILICWSDESAIRVHPARSKVKGWFAANPMTGIAAARVTQRNAWPACRAASENAAKGVFMAAELWTKNKCLGSPEFQSFNPPERRDSTRGGNLFLNHSCM